MGGTSMAAPLVAGCAALVREHYATPVSYTHLRAHETVLDLVCRLLLEKKKQEQLQELIHLRE